jgi:hypothetical protein
MNRRAIIAALIGSATSLYSRFAWATTQDMGASAAIAAGRLANLKLLAHDHQVWSLAFSRGAYRVETADGKSMDYLEADLRLKIDSSHLGPRPGAPIIIPAGTEGDRVWVVFASPAEISSFIDYN